MKKVWTKPKLQAYSTDEIIANITANARTMYACHCVGMCGVTIAR